MQNPTNSAKRTNFSTHPNREVPTVDAAQYLITIVEDGSYITEAQLHQLLFVAQTTLWRDSGDVFTNDVFKNAGSLPQATPLAEILKPIKPEALSDSDSELRFDNESYIGGSITHLALGDRQWLDCIMDRYIKNAPEGRLAEICAKSPVLNRVEYGEVIDFCPAGISR